MPDDSVKKTLIVALAVGVVCSVLVSATAVSLQKIQEGNRKADRIRNILAAADLSFTDTNMLKVYQEKISPAIIDLSTGNALSEKDFNEIINYEKFNVRSVAADPLYGATIAGDRDIAGIKRMPGYMLIYFVKEKGKISKVVLPVYGKGLWSTMYGFIALGRDLKTVEGFTIYEHAETPGLGGEVDNPRWKESWKGKRVFDETGKLRIQVIKGKVDNARPDAQFRIDGLSGATITTRGVGHMVRFWLSENGYGTFLDRLAEDLHG